MKLTPENVLSDLIRINSSNPPGNETAVAVYLKKLFADFGVDGEVIEPETGRGSFIARIGKGSKRLLFVSHIDVVPAGDDWDFDPFGGEIKDGIIYGRGSLDCKDLTAAQVVSALELFSEGLPLNGELIIAAMADEEKGGTLGAGYLIDKYPEKLMADYAINEGAEQPIFQGDKMIYFFQVGEKGIAWCKLRAKGVAGHGSVPTLADNAVVKLARALSKLHEYRSQVVLIPEVEKLLGKLAVLCGANSSSVSPEKVDKMLEEMGLNKAFTETLRSMTRMTISPNIIQGGTKTNIVPDFCEAEVDIRILPGQDKAYVEKELRPVIGEEIEIEFTEYQMPTFSSADDPFYKLMETVTLDMAGSDAICLPAISAGSTDSKYLRSAGIPSYGIGHMDKNYDQQARITVHGRNERNDVASLRFKTAFLKKLARRYLA
ncbi:MAG: M20/M25/M40 family metallo-hydrolase [Bacillota bacterium]|nr:M20/M25/M40 family metallo-hydrolase [Bacillota bacterium]